MARYQGLTIDQLVSATIVLADGSIVTANEKDNSDLFYALRGGGGKLKKSGKAKVFVDAMKRKAQDKDSAYFTTGELYALADDLQLQIPDVDAFIDSLNMAGEILKSGRLWKAA